MARLTASVWATSSHQLAWARAVCTGLSAQGVTILPPRTPADIGIVWGVRNKTAPRHCKHLLIMERAYLGDRFEWLSLGWDGLNGRADFCNQDVPDDRWRKYWRDQMQPVAHGTGVLLIGQVDGDAALAGVSCARWAADVGNELYLLGVPWVYRAHPESLKRGQQQPWPSDPRPMEQALAECDAVITYNSNVGVLAAMAGKRVTCENEGSMVHEIAGHGWRDDKELGDRDEWGRKLAYCQWLPEEVERGEFWETLRRKFE